MNLSNGCRKTGNMLRLHSKKIEIERADRHEHYTICPNNMRGIIIKPGG